jgi:hypothetical protein
MPAKEGGVPVLLRHERWTEGRGVYGRRLNGGVPNLLVLLSILAAGLALANTRGGGRRAMMSDHEGGPGADE